MQMSSNLVINQQFFFKNPFKKFSNFFDLPQFSLNHSGFIDYVQIFAFLFMKRVLPGGTTRLSHPSKGSLNSNFGDGPNFFRGFISRVS